MNFVPTQNYNDDKASGGLIDFAKGSLITGNRDSTEPKGRKKKAKLIESPEFKPKELFCDRDIEYTPENLTSATAIVSAYSEEDIAHLDQLRKKRQQLWAKRREEEEEFLREAERLKRSLSDEEISDSEEPNIEQTSDNTCSARPSLFSTKPRTTCVSQPITISKGKVLSICTPPEHAHHEGYADGFPAVNVAEYNGCKSVASSSCTNQQTVIVTAKVNLPLIEGYSSGDEGEDTAA